MRDGRVEMRSRKRGVFIFMFDGWGQGGDKESGSGNPDKFHSRRKFNLCYLKLSEWFQKAG